MNATGAQRAYDHIRRKLARGDLSPGTQLVNRTLAKEIGVSAIPVREALSRLATEGLITHVSGAGAFVRRPDRREVIELYGLREAMETYAAAEAARVIGDAELAELRGVLAAWQAMIDGLEASGRDRLDAAASARWLDLDRRFHEALIAASRNRWLSKVVGDLRLLALVFAPVPPGQTAPVMRETLAAHAELVEALARRDPDRARRCMAEQIRVGLRHVLEAGDWS